MVIPTTRLEMLQTLKLLQSVRQRRYADIERLIANGVPRLLDYNDPGADGAGGDPSTRSVGETALTLAAYGNDVDMVRFLLEHGAGSDVADLRGRKPVLRAAEAGNPECLECLATAGADLDAVDSEGRGVLFYCASSSSANHVVCAHVAVRQDADVNLVAADGSTALRVACDRSSDPGGDQLSRLLIDYGADPNAGVTIEANVECYTMKSRTALMAACSAGNARVVELLLERGARVNDRVAETGRRAVHEAAAGGHLPVLQVLFGYRAVVNAVDKNGNSPLHVAATNGHALCCKFLGQRGCDPKLKNEDGLTAQMLAKQAPHGPAAKECRRAEAAFGKPSGNVTPAWAIALYDFCYQRRQQLADAFEQLDADRVGSVDRQDLIDTLVELNAPLPPEPELLRLMAMHEGGKSIPGAVDYKEFLTGKKYVTKKYRAEAFDPTKKRKKKKGRSRRRGKGRGRKTRVQIQICTRPGGPRTEDGGPSDEFVPRDVRVTDPARFDSDGRRPRHFLEDDSYWYLPPSNTDYIRLNHAVRHADLDTLQAVLAERGAECVDQRDRFYKTPLMVAAAEGNVEVVEFLFNNGANVNAADNFKWTPLHFACRSGRRDVVEFLLDRQAALDATTLGGATPLMRAVESGRPEVVQLLVDKGADVRLVNRKGKTVMNLAATFGDQRIYDIVRDKCASLAPRPAEGDKPPTGKQKPKARPNK